MSLAEPVHLDAVKLDHDIASLVHDWNVPGGVEAGAWKPGRHIELDDETLRDGLQNPSVTDPSLEDKRRILHLMDRIGIDSADIGLPGAGPKAFEHVKALCEEIRDSRLKVAANCAGRTLIQDAEPMVRITQETGVPIEACLFIGSSPIRQFVEEWTVDDILRRSTEAISYAVKEGLPVMYVTEDTTRADPDTLRRLYTAAVEAGAKRVCVSDTVGHATPEGAYEVVRFVRGIVDATGEAIKVDWHGHRDRGLGVANCLAAIRAGADRVPRRSIRGWWQRATYRRERGYRDVSPGCCRCRRPAAMRRSRYCALPVRVAGRGILL